MAGVPDLNEVKEHLRVDGTELDRILARLLGAAVDSVARTLGRSVPWVELDDQGREVQTCPDAVAAAILLQVEALYGPKGSSPDVNSRAVLALLTPYRINMGV
ncbi:MULTISPECIES: head-tail connector protein [Achromobacter]|uniref:head-tail connector protein n=1 Tax=Achromobacter TaxID=222 RepID=UPI00047C9C9C|nr:MULTISPECIES: head-tail connector protein [Achromobacter]MDH0520583.1 head-tail connector protein [Achromobacter xylosoxidans]MDH0547336.1 head-tail connector protein [Achromobacter xylosoxidans]